MRLNSNVLRAAILAIGVTAVSFPVLAQTSTDSGAMNPDQGAQAKGVAHGKMLKHPQLQPRRMTTGSSSVSQTTVRHKRMNRPARAARPGEPQGETPGNQESKGPY